MAINVPAGMKNGLITNSLPNGNIEIALVSKGRGRGAFEAAPDAMGHLVQQVINITMFAHQRMGQELQSGVDHVSTWPTVAISSLALGPCEVPGHASLIIRFGESQIGIPLPHAALRSLGEAMIAASAR